MAELNKSYRIRTKLNENGTNLETPVINVHLDQTYDMFEILSLKLSSTDSYKYYESAYGVVVGRVVANGNFGIPNAKISVFVPVEDTATLQQRLDYNFVSVTDTDNNSIRYNTLPDYTDNPCHQNVGTFPNKRYVLDNDDIIETFDKYWRYTTVSNEAGDYMLFGVPTGAQTLHVDVDLSDCGMLSQRPRDLTYKGYNANLFDSPNKFKSSTNLNSLTQIYSQDRGLYVYPYWGERDENGDNIAITRCDIQIEYKFEPTCVFIGSMITDTGSNAIGKNCTGTDSVGKMSDLVSCEGKIEMIRKTLDGKVEQYQIKGDRLIDSDGVWCYQIPMNLDYVMTDEFGNIVPTDNPEKGIPTRARVRFRMSLDQSINDATARKRCCYLVPNNPKLDPVDYPNFYETHEADYEFGTNTKEESYRDLFWNKVYTVKNYIPRLQKNKKITNRKHTGIKLINHYGDNNPMPYNALNIKLNFTYRLICVLTKVIVYIIETLNIILGTIMTPFCAICKILKGLGKIPLVGFVFKALSTPFCAIVLSCIKLSSEFCDDGINKLTYYPGCWGCQWSETKNKHNKSQKSAAPEERTQATNDTGYLFTCVENSLAQDNNVTSFLFQNDWVNGVLYAPLWYRKITPKKSFLFGLFKRKAKDQWCSADNPFNLMLFQACALKRTASTTGIDSPLDGKHYDVRYHTQSECESECHNTVYTAPVQTGVILTRQTMLGQTVYYYKAAEYDTTSVFKKDFDGKGTVKILFATDIVLLGSLNDCDIHGIPQFFKNLESTTYKLPTDILFTDTVISIDTETGSGVVTLTADTVTEMTGCDWGNLNSVDECGKMGEDDDSGLFYSIGCSTIEMKDKSCINLSRICEFGVSLDEAKFIPDLGKLSGGDMDDNESNILRPDGFISFDELYNINERSMFATLNGNNLRTKLNKTNGLLEYDFSYLYTDNFDGSLKDIMTTDLANCQNVTYASNANLETFSNDYYLFRMGNRPYFYDNEGRMPRYDNSFYFYFGLKSGKTAIEKFNAQFFAECENMDSIGNQISVVPQENEWCSELSKNKGDMKGSIAIDVTGISTPYDVVINSVSNASIGYEINDINDEKIYFGNRNDDLDGQKYVNIEKYTDGSIITLLNDDYEITIIDSEGSITTTKTSMKGTYLTYQYDVVDFVVPNNQKFSQYNSLTTILGKVKDDMGKTKNSFGGYVVVTDIVPDGKYKISIEPFDVLDLPKDTNSNWTGTAVNVTVSDGKFKTTADAYSNSYYKIINGTEFCIAVPKGDIAYKLTVTELCDGVESRNSVSVTVTVGDPLPYKLYINSIDTEVFTKGKFNTGWTDGNKFNVNSIAGWTSLSDEELYDWDKLTDYARLEEEYEGDELTAKQSEFKSNFITKIKEAFWLTCPNDGKDIVLSVSANNFPINYKIVYSEEEKVEDVNYLNKLVLNNNGSKNKYQFGTDNYTISNIMIPTITSVDNETFVAPKERYNDNYAKGDSLSFGFDNYSDQGQGDERWIKRPYHAAICDNAGNPLPVSAKCSDITGEDVLSNPNLISNFFDFHIIDKIFRLNFVAWSYFNDLPFFFPTPTTDDERKKVGQTVSASGILSGYLYNGIPVEHREIQDKPMYYDVSFSRQDYNNQTIGVTTIRNEKEGAPGHYETYEETEDRIPSKRLLTTAKSDGATSIYTEYKVIENSNLDKQQYIEVPNKELDLTLEDSTCSIDETIYGKLKVVLSSDSLNNCKKPKKSVFKATLSGGDDDTDEYRYFMVRHDVIPYPINNFDVNSTLYNGDYTIFGYDTDLYNIAHNGVTGYYINDEDKEKKTGKKGYSENGKFTGMDKDKCYYVIGKTSNNCRCISPVYEFTSKNVSVTPQIGYTKEDGEEGGTTYTLDITINGDPGYYIRNYSFTVSVNYNAGDLSISGDATLTKSENNIIKADKYSSMTDYDQTYYMVDMKDKQIIYKTYTYLTEADVDDDIQVPCEDIGNVAQMLSERIANDYGIDVTYTDLNMIGEFGDDNSRVGFIHFKKYDTGDDEEVGETDKYITIKRSSVEDVEGEQPKRVAQYQFSDPQSEKPSGDDYFEISNKYLYYAKEKNRTQIEGSTESQLTSVTYGVYNVIESFVVVDETTYDPSIEHYKKPASIPITEEQYKYAISSKGKKKIKKNMEVIITDYTSLRHLANIK